MNGEFVATLDLSGLLDAGRVSAIAGYFSDEVAGKSTQFEEFKITPIQSAPAGGLGPVDGSIEHKDDGQIDVYAANVSLADGIIEAQFFNPYSSHSDGATGLYSADIFHTVVVTQAGRWLRVTHPDQPFHCYNNRRQ